MKLTLQTRVNQDFKNVFRGFDRELFRKLAPPFPHMHVIRFDGCKTGDKVEVELKTGLTSHFWSSLITQQQENDYEIYFVDEGQVLPKPLKFWRHKHVIYQNGKKTIISDQVEYKTGSELLDYLILPLMYLNFLYRKPVYKKYFK